MFSKRFIEKKIILKEKIITFYDPIPCKWDGIEEQHPGLMIHSINYLQCVNLVKYNKVVKEQGRYKIEDIKHLNGVGFIIGKRGDRYITHVPVPVKIDERKDYINLYQSTDAIRSIDYNFEGEIPYLYLSDCDEYLKKFEMPRRDSTQLKLVTEYYTFPGFTGREIYRINSGLIFVKTLGVQLQEKYLHLKSNSRPGDQYMPTLDMVQETIDDEFPLVSQDVLMFCGKIKSKSMIFKQSKALILPSYTSPLFRLLPNEFDRFLKNEFFFYPKSTNKEYVVYQLNRTDTDCIEFAFYKQNGKYETSVFLHINGLKNYSNANVSVSPNGRYIFYVEVEKPKEEAKVKINDEDSKQFEESLNSNSSRQHKIKSKKTLIGKVWEIVSLRSKNDSQKLLKIMKKFKTLKDKFDQKLKESINMDDVDFNLRPVKIIQNVGNTLSLYKHRIDKDEEPSFEISVTDSGSVIILDKECKHIFYNEIDLYEPNKKKLGLQPESKARNDITNMNFAYTQYGVLAYNSEEIYYLKVNLKMKKVEPVKRIDFKINKDRLFIKSVIGCPDPRYILITLSTPYDELILLVWDLKTNTEMCNYSLQSEFSFISKPDCKFGVILAKDFYINLDVGLINYYFDHNFSDFPWTSGEQGLKMDRAEKTILYKGRLLMKEMYSECEVLNSLIEGNTVYNERNENEKMSAYLMMMQIDGNTIIHLYSIDFIPLSLMLNYMEKRKPYMLNSILMKNNKGQTPIDIAIKFESMKTINILLQYLSKLTEASYSRLIQNKFNRLLSMNLISFHTYLESWFFQTIQMKGIKFLKLKYDDKKQIYTHTSCLIDDSFLRRYTNEKLDGENSHLMKKPSKKKKNKPKNDRGEVYKISSSNDDEIFESSKGEGDENSSEIEIPASSESEILDADEAFYQTDQKKNAQGKGNSNNFSHDSSQDDIEGENGEEFEEGEDSEEGEEENDDIDSDQISESEEEEGGEKDKEEKKQPNQPGSPEEFMPPGGAINNQQKASVYDPFYNVFTTENKQPTTEIHDNAHSHEVEEMEDYFRKNVSSDEISVRKFRTERLVPPNEIKATEMEEKRINDFEKNLRKEQDIQRARTLRGGLGKSKSLQKLDTKNMTREQLMLHREQERASYYRENIKKNLPILNIRAIEFDWLFGKQGAAFLKTMAETDSIELFSLNIIKEIILFFWQYYRIRIIITGLIPFIINFWVFVAYATFLHWESGDGYKTAADVWAIITIGFASYFLFFEFLYIFEKRKNYLKSFWNHVNLLSIGLNSATVAIDYFNKSDSKYFVPVSSWAILIMWLKLFYFGRMFNSTATIVRMIIEISKDMVPFLIIIFVLLAGFTNAFFIIALNVKTSGADRFTGNDIGHALTYTWQQGLGQFYTDSFFENNYAELVFVLWLMFTFFFLIVFLNLLIAVLSDSFDKIQETLENNLLKELAIMMKDNEILLNRKSVFKGVKYLIVIEKVLIDHNEGGWGGRLDYVNKIIKRTRSIHFRLMDKITDRVDQYFDNSLTYKIGAMDQTTDKSLNYIVDKIDRLDNNLKIYKDVFTRVMALK